MPYHGISHNRATIESSGTWRFFRERFRKRDLSSFGIDIQINGLLTRETRYNISLFTTQRTSRTQAATGAQCKRYSFCERETAPATLEQAHKLSARVSPIAAPAVTGGEKVAANGAKENARWITFVCALTAASDQR